MKERKGMKIATIVDSNVMSLKRIIDPYHFKKPQGHEDPKAQRGNIKI